MWGDKRFRRKCRRLNDPEVQAKRQEFWDTWAEGHPGVPPPYFNANPRMEMMQTAEKRQDGRLKEKHHLVNSRKERRLEAMGQGHRQWSPPRPGQPMEVVVPGDNQGPPPLYRVLDSNDWVYPVRDSSRSRSSVSLQEPTSVEGRINPPRQHIEGNPKAKSLRGVEGGFDFPRQSISISYVQRPRNKGERNRNEDEDAGGSHKRLWTLMKVPKLGSFLITGVVPGEYGKNSSGQDIFYPLAQVSFRRCRLGKYTVIVHRVCLAEPPKPRDLNDPRLRVMGGDEGVRGFDHLYHASGGQQKFLEFSGGDDSDKIRKKLTEIDCLRETSKALKEMADAAGADREMSRADSLSSARYKRRELLAWRRLKNRQRDLSIMHCQYIVNNCDVFYRPVFNTGQMMRRRGEDGRRRLIRKWTVRVMQAQSHGASHRRLEQMCYHRGVTMLYCSEAYTTQTCPCCFVKNKKVGGAKDFKCADPSCGYVGTKGRRSRDIKAAVLIPHKHLKADAAGACWNRKQACRDYNSARKTEAERAKKLEVRMEQHETHWDRGRHGKAPAGGQRQRLQKQRKREEKRQKEAEVLQRVIA